MTIATPLDCSLTAGTALAFDNTLLELLPAALYVCDAQGRIVLWNGKAANLWGRVPRRGDPDEKFCGAHRLFWPDGRPLPHADTPMADALRTGRSYRDVEVQVEQPNGRRVWLAVNIDPIRNDAGDITGAINCFQDTTPRKEAEARLLSSETMFRLVVETTPECVKIVSPDGTLHYMNRAGLRMVDAQAPEDVVGACTFDLIAPEHREAWRRQHQRVCGGKPASWEFDIIGRSGARRHMETHATPLTMPDGRVAQLAITRDITQRKRDEEALRDSERRLRDLLEALPAAVYTTDANGYVTFFNQAARELAGREPRLGTDQWCVAWRLSWPDGTPLPHEQCPMAIALAENRALKAVEAAAERPDGVRVPFLAHPTPLRDASGALVGAVNMLVDITERKKADERRQILLNELNHRVKNTLATVQSMAMQSFRGALDTDAYRRYEDRLMALAKAHDILTRESWQGADLLDLVCQAVSPLNTDDEGRFVINGPNLRLRPSMALSMAMVLHELCTNAVKYGALSSTAGKVVIAWHVTAGDGGDQLHFRWKELDGPVVAPPTRKGFGSRLIERGIAGQLGASVRLAFPSRGVECDIEVPLPTTTPSCSA